MAGQVHQVVIPTNRGFLPPPLRISYVLGKNCYLHIINPSHCPYVRSTGAQMLIFPNALNLIQLPSEPDEPYTLKPPLSAILQWFRYL